MITRSEQLEILSALSESDAEHEPERWKCFLDELTRHESAAYQRGLSSADEEADRLGYAAYPAIMRAFRACNWRDARYPFSFIYGCAKRIAREMGLLPKRQRRPSPIRGVNVSDIGVWKNGELLGHDAALEEFDYRLQTQDRGEEDTILDFTRYMELDWDSILDSAGADAELKDYVLSRLRGKRDRDVHSEAVRKRFQRFRPDLRRAVARAINERHGCIVLHEEAA
jgi:hypothetical protein